MMLTERQVAGVAAVVMAVSLAGVAAIARRKPHHAFAGLAVLAATGVMTALVVLIDWTA